LDVNLESLSETISLDTPCSLATSFIVIVQVFESHIAYEIINKSRCLVLFVSFYLLSRLKVFFQDLGSPLDSGESLLSGSGLGHDLVSWSFSFSLDMI
jgi:hypothetical protein